MSEEETYDDILHIIEGKSLKEIADLLEGDESLSKWIRVRSDSPTETLASANSDCAVWVYDPSKGGWICLRKT